MGSLMALYFFFCWASFCGAERAAVGLSWGYGVGRGFCDTKKWGWMRRGDERRSERGDEWGWERRGGLEFFCNCLDVGLDDASYRILTIDEALDSTEHQYSERMKIRLLILVQLLAIEPTYLGAFENIILYSAASQDFGLWENFLLFPKLTAEQDDLFQILSSPLGQYFFSCGGGSILFPQSSFPKEEDFSVRGQDWPFWFPIIVPVFKQTVFVLFGGADLGFVYLGCMRGVIKAVRGGGVVGSGVARGVSDGGRGRQVWGMGFEDGAIRVRCLVMGRFAVGLC
ncbi:hypothetical protein Tco_0631608 [Tanacetum coccineum]